MMSVTIRHKNSSYAYFSCILHFHVFYIFMYFTTVKAIVSIKKWKELVLFCLKYLRGVHNYLVLLHRQERTSGPLPP